MRYDAHTPPSPLANPLRPLVRAVRRALWRHVGRFVTESHPRYGQARPRAAAERLSPQHRPLRLV